jgi:hypothetical protein
MPLDLRLKAVADFKTEFLFDMVADLDRGLRIGDGGFGRRVLFGSAGGAFEGPRLHGEVLPGGGDWALFRSDGAMTLDVRLTLRTHDGALIYMTYGGRLVVPAELQAEMNDPVKRHQIDPAQYYFRTNPLFETGSSQYAWLNDVVCVGSGYLVEGAVAYKVSQVM